MYSIIIPSLKCAPENELIRAPSTEINVIESVGIRIKTVEKNYSYIIAETKKLRSDISGIRVHKKKQFLRC